ncbi:MAG TPA: hypothetical protein VGH17_07230 [Candidatus Acidoferrales bacterium]|jgi:hypothetical protein
MKMQRVILAALFAFFVCGAVPPLAKAQSSSGTGSSSTTSHPSVQPGQTYVKPSDRQKFHNYLFDSFGPYAILGSAIAAGINQASGDRINGTGSGTPPEWGGGAQAYGQRFASNFGINLTATSARYLMAELFREDTVYYRCECSGFSHRLVHSLWSTVATRHGDDGHYRFSFSNLAAPYAGTMTAALGWYPGRYEPSDGFRMGNYLLVTYAGLNIAKEFIYGGPHTLAAHTPLKHVTGSDKP